MYKPSTYLLVTYFPTYLPLYETYFPTELVTKVKPNINSVEVHPQLSNNEHPVDGELVGAGSLWPLRSFDSNYIILRNVQILKKILFSRAIFCEETTESFEIFWHIPLLYAKSSQQNII